MNSYLIRMLFLLLLLAGLHTLPAQSLLPFDEWMVIASSLRLRAEPAANAEVLATIPNGELVMHISSLQPDKPLVVNGLKGYWIKVRYREQEGFVFSAYLSGKYVLLSEGATLQNAPVVKYWYGVYYTETGEMLRPISVRFDTVKYDDGAFAHLALKSNQKDTSIFIIGLNKPLSSRQAGIWASTVGVLWNDPDYIRAGDQIALPIGRDRSGFIPPCYYLLATGSYELESWGFTQKDFRLFVADNYSRYKVRQELTHILPGIESFKPVWAGDLDQDGKPDLILECTTFNAVQDVLLLSSEAGPDELLRPVAVYVHPPEC
ncbi:MAG: SH3 domain-containing protein [Saprospiraceae bacterium]|nr:SH3 domain-containing protein [Saprospiraceae bacterium]